VFTELLPGNALIKSVKIFFVLLFHSPFTFYQAELVRSVLKFSWSRLQVTTVLWLEICHTDLKCPNAEKMQELYKLDWLTAMSWILLEKPPVAQLLKNFPTFYGTRKFITVFTRALHLSLSWARWIQSIIQNRTWNYISSELPGNSWLRLTYRISYKIPTLNLTRKSVK
jgi:hypothetical protein